MDEYGNVARAGHAFEAVQNVDSRELGHRQIKQNDIGSVLVREAEAGATIRRLNDDEAVFGQHFADE